MHVATDGQGMPDDQVLDFEERRVEDLEKEVYQSHQMNDRKMRRMETNRFEGSVMKS